MNIHPVEFLSTVIKIDSLTKMLFTLMCYKLACVTTLQGKDRALTKTS